MPNANPGFELGIHADLFYWPILSADLIMTHDLGWMFESPQNSYVETLTPNVSILGGGAFGRQLGHEVGVPKNEISVPIIRDMRDRAFSLSAMWGYKKTANSKRGSGPSPDPRSVSTPILNLPASRTVRDKCFLTAPLHVWYSVTSARTD